MRNRTSVWIAFSHQISCTIDFWFWFWSWQPLSLSPLITGQLAHRGCLRSSLGSPGDGGGALGWRRGPHAELRSRASRRGALKPPLCLALGLSCQLRLHVSCMCCPAAAQGGLNIPDAFQPAGLSSCSLTRENPSSSRSLALDGEVKVTMGTVRGGIQLGGWGYPHPLLWVSSPCAPAPRDL